MQIGSMGGISLNSHMPMLGLRYSGMIALHVFSKPSHLRQADSVLLY
jgi:hypothetical protein